MTLNESLNIKQSGSEMGCIWSHIGHRPLLPEENSLCYEQERKTNNVPYSNMRNSLYTLDFIHGIH
jgi:hypothetical protein